MNISELQRAVISTFAEKNGKNSSQFVIEISDTCLTRDQESGNLRFHMAIREIEGPLHDLQITIEDGGDIYFYAAALYRC